MGRFLCVWEYRCELQRHIRGKHWTVGHATSQVFASFLMKAIGWNRVM